MKVQPIASPSAMKTVQMSTNGGAREAAIKAFTTSPSPAPAAQPAPQIVQNQNAVSPEEMGAIQPPAAEQTDSVEAQAPAETPEPTTPETPAEDPAISRQFAQLARQEKAMRAKVQQQEQALKAREAAIAAKEAELASKAPDMTKYVPKDQIKDNALAVLADAGVSYEELTQQIISQQPVDPRLQNTINKLESKIRELEAANETTKKSYADQQTAAYQAAVKQIEVDVKSLVQKDPNFETIKATKSTKDVVDLITKTYNEDGVLLTVEEAAQQVEDYLVEEGLKIAQIDKIKRKMQAVAPKASTSTAQTPAAKPQQPQPMKTLTNATSSTRQLSAKERAILAFKGVLAKS